MKRKEKSGIPTLMASFFQMPESPRQEAAASPRIWGRPQIPAYHEYPKSGSDDPSPLPNFLMSSVTVTRVIYFTLLYPSCLGTLMRSGPPLPTGSSPPFSP